MNLKEQTYVCVLAECGNITKAADRLYISQPALSIYINNLEKSLGTKLFERAGKRFVLTPAGELYVEKARKMLELKKESTRPWLRYGITRGGKYGSECSCAVKHGSFPRFSLNLPPNIPALRW